MRTDAALLRTTPALTGERKGGLTTRIGFEESSRREADRDGFRRRLGQSLGVAPARWAWLRQVHGAEVQIPRGPGAQGEGDALATADPTVGLLIAVADCCPVLLWQERGPGLGAVHAGWRGLVAGVLQNTVAALGTLGAPAASLRAWVGPSIGPCCFEVGPDVAARFSPSQRRPSPRGRPDREHVDLRQATVDALKSCGVAPDRVTVCPDCTACHPTLYWSYRRDGGICGRHLAYLVHTAAT